MAEGEFALVREYLEASIGKLSLGWTNVGDHELYAMLADAATQQRDEPALHHYAPLAEQTARHYGHTLYQAIAHRAWGVARRLAGQYAAAESRLSQALALFQNLGTRWQIGRTYVELGELALAQNNTLTAHDHFAQALTMFEAMQATLDAARVRSLMKQTVVER